MSAALIDGKALAKSLERALADRVQQFVSTAGFKPQLAAVLVGEDPASKTYVSNKEKACARAGLASQLHRLPASTTEAELLALISSLNADRTVHGILIQLPLPPQINQKTVLDAVTPLKDVDCFHPENVGRLVQGRPRFLPCTPHGVMQMLAHHQIETAGRRAVILGRSEIVGKPLANMLLAKGADATVTICHSRTRDLPAVTREADILIAAIGRPRFVTAEMVRPGAVVIDVGINRTESGLCGDVDFDALLPIASQITPVPGGVGPMTIAMLLENTLTAAQLLA